MCRLLHTRTHVQQFSHAVLAQHDAPFASALVLSYDGGGNDGCLNVFWTPSRAEWPISVCTAECSNICPGMVYGVLSSLIEEVSDERCDAISMKRLLSLAGGPFPPVALAL